MEPIDEFKTQRRRELSKARAALGDDARSAMDHAIAQNVQSLPEYQNAEVIAPYLSFGAEVDTRELIRDAWSCGKTVALPRCVEGTRDMRWFKVESFDGLVTSKFGVDEPADDPQFEIDLNATEQVLAIVPGFEFDHDGFRLGYGGGFYDTLLASFSGSAVGLCRSPFLRDEPIARGTYDLAVGIIVTDERIIRVQ